MSFQKNPAAVRCFSLLTKLMTWLQKIPDIVTPPPFRLIRIGSAFWQSRILYVAVCLDIATVLGDERLKADDIAGRVSAQPDAIYRLVRMLAAMGVFEEVAPGYFRNNRLSAFLREDNPKNVRAMIMLHNSNEMSLPWLTTLEQGIRAGEIPFQLVHDCGLYAYMDKHSEFDLLFARAMDSVESLAGDSFVNDFDWGRFARIIDVGGSKGCKSLSILKRYPQLNALVFDRHLLVQTALTYWTDKESADLLSRISFQAGDMLESMPPAKDDKDVYLLSAVLHGMDEATCVKVLRNLVSAIGNSGARIALMEIVVAEFKADFASAACDMQMFMATKGRERTRAEWKAIFERTGLVLEESIDLQSFVKILVLKVE